MKERGGRKETRKLAGAGRSYRVVSWRFALLLLVSLFGCEASAGEGREAKHAKPAKVKVSGYGLLGNFELKRILRTLELSGKKPAFFGPAFIEDAALILSARV